MADPLSLATRGRFTSTSYENSYPITLATHGRILEETVSQGKSKNKQKVCRWDECWDENREYYKYSEKLRNLVARTRQEKTEEIVRDEQIIEIEQKGPEKVIQAPPIKAYSQPLYDITDDLERELARELRRLAIIDHARNEREILTDNIEKLRKYRKKLGVMLMLLLEESDD